MPDLPPPIALSMVICDQVVIDQDSQKPYLLGAFSVINAKVFPFIHQRMAVFVELTNGRGSFNAEFRVADTDGERDPVVRLPMVLDFPHGPLADSRCLIFLEGLVFPKPGEYRVQLLVGETPLIQRRLVVNSLQAAEGAGQ